MTNKISAVCLLCDALFYVDKYDVKIGKGIFCSKECYAKYRKEQGTFYHNCLFCGKIFKAYKTHIKRGGAKYCSHPCYSKSKITPKKLVIKPRQSVLYEEWRQFVFVRDNYTCVICKNRGGTLNAHHIIPYSADLNLALDVNNGITLCIKCHRKLHNKMKKEIQMDIFHVKYKKGNIHEESK